MPYIREIDNLMKVVHEKHPYIVLICVKKSFLDALEGRLLWTEWSDGKRIIEGWTLMGLPVEIDEKQKKDWEVITIG